MPADLVTTARVAVAVAPGQLELVEMPLPPVGDDDGLLLVETNGVCGSDLELLHEPHGYVLPMVLGHEPTGRVLALGANARARTDMSVGDRVAVNSQLRCGHCAACRGGGGCLSFPGTYGTMPASFAPGLWGGFATHMHLSPAAQLVRVAESVTTAELAFHNPLANGFEWAVEAGGAGPTTDVLVLGAGPRGLACALAARYVGAQRVTVTGLAHDAGRLELARALGVDATVVVESGETDELRDKTGLHAVVIDTTPRSGAAVRQALAAVQRGGRVVLCGLKGPGVRLEVDVDALVLARVSVLAPPSKTPRSFERAVEALNSRQVPLGAMTTRSFPLVRTAEAINTLTATDPDRPFHARVDPQT